MTDGGMSPTYDSMHWIARSMYQEINFDGLVGPTHNYAGLSQGNRASMIHRAAPSHPRAAALQGLEKMRLLAKLGFSQAFLPPPRRPAIRFLRSVGFSGSDQQMIERAYRDAPELLAASFSASSMWTANAATVAPSPDSYEGKTHFTPANLLSNLHRSLEAHETAANLRTIFSDPNFFVHHDPLPSTPAFSDEGAANHLRIAPHHGARGIHIFVYGRRYFGEGSPTRFPQRQTLEACEAIARRHALRDVLYLQQSPEAIDAGAFHNDVISTANCRLFLYHQHAFVDPETFIAALKKTYLERYETELQAICVKEFDLATAVSSYFFNSQILSRPDQSMVLIAPVECQETAPVADYIESLIENKDCPIDEVFYLDLRESMRNGGGPACLRNRVVLSDQERASLPEELFITQQSFDALRQWITGNYREELVLRDLLDPQLKKEIDAAFSELSSILKGNFYLEAGDQ